MNSNRGAVIQPKQNEATLGQAMQNPNTNLENSMRGSNILSTPSSKGGEEDV